MKTVLDLKVENFNVIVREETSYSIINNQTYEEKGLTWAVYCDGNVLVFCTIVYNSNKYTAKYVASNGINWIANQEKTSKERFLKARELKDKYLN
jgi:hypothetical protein